MVWAWSRSRVLADDQLEGSQAPRHVMPESLYRGQPQAEGGGLLAMDRGVEGRVWRNYLLNACQWWPQTPTLQEWNQFRRAAGLGADMAVPQVETPPLADRSWTPSRTVGLGDVVNRHRQLVGALAIGLGAAVLSTQMAAAFSLVVASWQVDRKIDAQDRSVQAVLAAREKAMTDARAVDALLALRPPASQVGLLAAVSELLPGGWTLLEWHMPQPDKLALVARIANPDPRVLVESWESSGRFRNVTVELGKDAREVAIQADVVRGTAKERSP